MSVELARRLFKSGAIPAEEVELALLDSVASGVAFPQALAARGAAILHLLERELAKTHVPLARAVRVVPELAAELPLGMCERLLAVPIGRDAKSGAVDLACVDPLDPQVGREMAHQLKSRVRVFRAPLTEVLLALELWLDERDALQATPSRTPAFGTRAVKKPSQPPPGRLSLRPPRALDSDPTGVPVARTPARTSPVGETPSEPPIPLVRRSLPPDETRAARAAERYRKGTDPGVGTRALQVVDLPETDEAGQPVIGLLRSKPPPPQVSPQVSPSVHISGVADEIVREASERLETAETPDQVVSGLVHGLEALATRAAVFAIRGGAYEARAGSSGLGDPERLRSVRLPAGEPSVIETAAESGYYLGLLPGTRVHDALRELFGDTEVYVARIALGDRPVLFPVMAGLETAFGATRRADELARNAARALERILRQRKRSD